MDLGLFFQKRQADGAAQSAGATGDEANHSFEIQNHGCFTLIA
jgi:hypothetical protein